MDFVHTCMLELKLSHSSNVPKGNCSSSLMSVFQTNADSGNLSKQAPYSGRYASNINALPCTDLTAMITASTNSPWPLSRSCKYSLRTQHFVYGIFATKFKTQPPPC